jgi:membrane protease YdiL (CAAX protease family)
MTSIRSFVPRHRLASFVALSYLFSWLTWPFYLQGSLDIKILSFGPFLAALLVLGLSVGRPGIRALVASMLKWRVGWPWYLVALGLPILLAALASALAVWRGAPVPSTEQLGAWPEIFVTFLFALLVPGLGGAWEEPGWRGYALHRLEERRSRLGALAPLWLIIVVWHLPLFAAGDIQPADVLNMVGGVVVYNWLYHKSGNSVLMVMIIHAMNNAASGEFFSPMFQGDAAAQQAWMRSLVWGVTALAVLAANWRWWRQVEDPEADPASPAHLAPG